MRSYHFYMFAMAGGDKFVLCGRVHWNVHTFGELLDSSGQIGEHGYVKWLAALLETSNDSREWVV